MAWKNLDDQTVLVDLIEASHQKPILIFKHSTTCPISHASKMRLDDGMVSLAEKADIYYLDLLRYRSQSNEIADLLQVHHESPQVILLKYGEVIFDESHLDIQVQELLNQIGS